MIWDGVRAIRDWLFCDSGLDSVDSGLDCVDFGLACCDFGLDSVDGGLGFSDLKWILLICCLNL